MLTYQHEERRHIDAPPDKVFAILAEVIHHDDLAGSGEVKSIRMVSEGEVRVGTEWEADEEIKVGRSTQKFIARSTVREYDPPRVFSWTSMPPISGKPVPRRIQWWYLLVPDAGGTQVVERVEVDMGPVMNLVMRVPYRFARAGTVANGMRRTLENLEVRATSTSGPDHGRPPADDVRANRRQIDGRCCPSTPTVDDHDNSRAFQCGAAPRKIRLGPMRTMSMASASVAASMMPNPATGSVEDMKRLVLRGHLVRVVVPHLHVVPARR
jgi:uncharacterized protein YndB with AHSA1/START domain